MYAANQAHFHLNGFAIGTRFQTEANSNNYVMTDRQAYDFNTLPDFNIFRFSFGPKRANFHYLINTKKVTTKLVCRIF